VTHESALTLAAGVDLLIHDAQYTRAEFATRCLFGHSAADYAAVLGERAGARRVLLYHHDPNRNDGEVAEIGRDVAARHPGVKVDIAAEGMEIDL
jgi:ribonuclease BN (tRNA processing enzyme)